ncbi:MAG: F420-dependent methylenetetrahydromethanopterin dehydrogenase [Asgard group archaeon]|nr:F420-dependent methylenetetrahydromethanopterin dehydrogenase [Asgard group archaeon]
MKEDLSWMVKNKSNSKKSTKNNPKNDKVTKVAILKLGNIASSILLEMLLDERADREDIDVCTVSSGAKMVKDSVQEATELIEKVRYDLLIVVTPNASLKVPSNAIFELSENKKPLIVITDKIKKETQEKFLEKNIGLINIPGDAMIGARREFLDPIEMTLFNADLLRVLSTTGVFTIIYKELNTLVKALQRKEEVKLPARTITPREAVKARDFQNPYAEAKAQAALEIAQQVAEVNTKGCFKIQERFSYLQQVATAHEMMRHAAKLADEVREIEKSQNKVKREPHYYDGDIEEKWLLKSKPRKI